MSKIKSFEELKAWQKSRKFSSTIYLVTDKSEFAKDFVFKRQIRKASVSISSNIAEGFE
tara:strand:+ start:887 stop:1063 length:177 start_codon:yes stop_codon:yes gene_type:complete